MIAFVPLPVRRPNNIRMKRRIFQFPLLVTSLCTAQFLFADWHTVKVDSLIGAKVAYRELTGLSRFPVPVLSFRRAGLASAGAREIEEIKEKIVVPVIKESLKPVSAIIIEFFPNRPTAIGVLVLWTDGEAREPSIVRSETEKYDPKAYKVFFKKPTP